SLLYQIGFAMQSSVYWPRGTSLFVGGLRDLVTVEAAAAEERRLGLLLLLLLLLAVDAQSGHRPGQQALDRDLLAALLALVDGACLDPSERAVDLVQQELLAVAQPQLGGEDLLLHGLVDGVPADVAL